RRDGDRGVPGGEGRLRRSPARLLRGAVGDAGAAGGRADRRPIPLRRDEGHLLMAAASRLASAGAVATAELAGHLPAARRRDMSGVIDHAILVASVVVLAFPLYYAFVISTQTLDEVTSLPPKLVPSTHMLQNYADAWVRAKMGRLLLNSAIVALAVAFGKIAISLLSAFAIVYFNFRGKQVVFCMIFITLMLPLSKANIAALFVILFVYGWNDYLWPLIVTNSPEMRTAVIGIDSLIPRTSQLPEWNVAMAAAMMVLLPPVVVIVVMQRWFVKGLIETEK